MALYLIAYDLRKPDSDYTDLESKLEELGAKRVQKSVWMLRSDETAKALKNELRPFVRNKDRLLVAEVASWSSRKAMTDIKTI